MWTKVGDDWLEYSEDLSPLASLAHLEALMVSNRRGLDLRIPADKLTKFPHPPPAHVVAELVRRGTWREVRRSRGEGAPDAVTYFADGVWPEWQFKAVVVEFKRAQTSLRKECERLHKAGDHSLCLKDSKCEQGHLVSRDQLARARMRDVTRDNPRDPGRGGSGQDVPGRDEEESPWDDDIEEHIAQLNAEGTDDIELEIV